MSPLYRYFVSTCSYVCRASRLSLLLGGLGALRECKDFLIFMPLRYIDGGEVQLHSMFTSAVDGRVISWLKVKAAPGRKGRRRSPTHLQPRRWKGLGGEHHAPTALLPGKTRYQLYRRLGGLCSRSGRARKISPIPGFDSRTVWHRASRYTDWAILAARYSGYWYETS